LLAGDHISGACNSSLLSNIGQYWKYHNCEFF
jgi:hypothetical protein